MKKRMSLQDKAEAALKKASEILIDQFRVVSEIAVPEVQEKKPAKAKKKKS